MKTDTRHRTTFGTRFRFLVRVLALFGVLAAAAGAVVAVPSFPPPANWNVAYFQSAASGTEGGYQRTAALLLLGGAGMLALWFLVELLSALTLLTGRKTASGTNAAVQVALAAALLVVVNALSFINYKRWDKTRDGEFTIAPELREKLAKLDSRTPTTIVALRVHKTASVAPDRSDNYDAAAERKVVEKVRDLTDVLREFGPKFDVRVLDTEDEDYAERVKSVAGEDAPFAAKLAEPAARKTVAAAFTAAIEGAPENSIFFAANGKFQRMAFNEFLLYDKTASKAEGKDKGERNLVLVPQGTDKFVGKLLALEERKPVVGVAVVHMGLSTRRASEKYSMPGLRAVLERNGFEVRDVILRKGWGSRKLTPVARSFEEDEFASTEAKFNRSSVSVSYFDTLLRQVEKAVAEARDLVEKFDKAVAANDRAAAVKHLEAVIDLLQPYAQRRIVNPQQAAFVLQMVSEGVTTLKQELELAKERVAEVRPKYEELLRNDRLMEAVRRDDVAARMKEFTASCDILVLPRMTAIQLAAEEMIGPSAHNLTPEQADPLREFLAAGKPILFAVGPTAMERQLRGRDGSDTVVDDLLARFGVTLGAQAVFTDEEGEAVAESGSEEDVFGRSLEIPPLRVAVSPADGKARNPLADAMDKSGRLVDGRLPISRSGFRPVYLSDQARRALPYAAVVAATGPNTWNEDRPLIERDEDRDVTYFPQFNPTKPGDPAKGTRDEERRGPFDVGVALEAPVPPDWLEPKVAVARAGALVAASLTPAGVGFPVGVPLAGLPTETFLPAIPEAKRPKPPTVRLVVLGHGGLFTGNKKMQPGEEALLLHSLNWQLRRDDKLPHGVPAGQEWKYPRVSLDPVQKAAWTGGAVALLPLACGVLGVIVLMVRRFR